MKIKKNCENCGTEFEYIPSRRPNARFCSWSCLSKKTKQEQDEERRLAWAEETKDDYLAAMKKKFEKFVIKKDGCWDWNGSKGKQGYGVMLHRHKYFKAHRASYMIHNNTTQIPNRVFVLHKCDNPSCSNPKHLFLGDQTANMRDMSQKERTKVSFGQSNKVAVLNIEQVKEIKKLLQLGVTGKRIANDFKVSQGTIYGIKVGRVWKHVKSD